MKNAITPAMPTWMKDLIRDVMNPTLGSLRQSRLAHEGPEFFRAYGSETQAFYSYTAAGQRLKSDCLLRLGPAE